MIELRKHIAVLLFGVFYFPILLQPVHIVWHHSHGYKCEKNLCSHTIINKDLRSDGEKVSEKEKICPICEYQFSINDLAKISFFNPPIPAIACIYVEIAKQQPSKQEFSAKTPRAPPVFIS